MNTVGQNNIHRNSKRRNIQHNLQASSNRTSKYQSQKQNITDQTMGSGTVVTAMILLFVGKAHLAQFETSVKHKKDGGLVIMYERCTG
jgi:hypothetical protein